MGRPASESNLRRAVLVVCDSLRADLIGPEATPRLFQLGAESCRCENHRSVFPSTTRTASASIATGCLPRNHGLLGNVVALDEGRGLAPVSTGRADYRDRIRALTGRVLTRPTLAQRLAESPLSGSGGAVIFSNATPGAAHVQDPDGHGTLYHRAGSHGPGLRPLPPAQHLDTLKGIEGDAAVTDRFVEEAVLGGEAALCVLWLSEPDFTGHAQPLGGPEHRLAMAAADACAGRVAEAVERLDPGGERVMLIVTSDHGQETTHRVIDVNTLLVEAGLKAAPDSTDIVPTSQGTAAVFYAAAGARERIPALLEFLQGQDWAEAVYGGATLRDVGLDSGGLESGGLESGGLDDGGAGNGSVLAAAVSMAKSDAKNEYGIAGLSDIMFEEGGINNPGRGQHGGLGAYEQSPFLFIRGGGFPSGTAIARPTSCIDLAPTILAHLGLPLGGMDGRNLQGVQ